MTTKPQTYPKYKPSGIDWLGDIPAGWDIVPTRSLFKTKKQIVGSNAEKHLLLGLTLGGVKPRNLSLGGKNPADYDNYQIFEPGELVMCLFDYDVTPRTVGYVKQKGMMTGAYTRLIPKAKLEPRYYYYLFLYFDEKKELLHLCTGLRNSISKHVFWSLQNPLPPLEIQKQIADFLDEKTKIIDELVAKKEKLIELLREKRAALITRAVTKGLDPHVKLKPSCVDWLGDIPEGWEIISLGKILDYEQPGNYISSAIDAAQYHENMVPVLTANKGFVIGYTDEKDGVFDKDLPIIIFDDFTTSKQFVDFPFKVRSSALKILKIRNKDENDIRFIFRSMEVLGFHVLEHNRHWIAMYSKVNIAHPSSHTQKQIADFLDVETGRIDKAVKLIESQIEKLKEYRSSLIYHAVTGKIKV